MPKRKAPINSYWRGNVLWGRIQVKGKEFRFSLRTRNAKIAARRVSEQQQWILLDIASDRPAPPQTDAVPDGKPLIYFIAKPGFVKIGTTRNLRERLHALKTSSPETLLVLFVLPGGIYQERTLHLKFAHLRVSGEWFRLDGDLIDFCRRHLQPGPLHELGLRVTPPRPTSSAEIVQLHPHRRLANA